jgi:hypothetical protein
VAVATCLRALDMAWPRGGWVGAAPAVQTRGALQQLRVAQRKDGPDRDESPTSTLAGLGALDLDGHSREASPDGLGAPFTPDEACATASEPDDVAPPLRIPRRRAFRGTAAAAEALLLGKRGREDDGL